VADRRAAVSNTSPLLYLHRIGQLGWLEQLFTDVITPPAVERALAEGRARGYDVPVLAGHAWLRIVAPATPLVGEHLHQLGPGEREAIALALEHHARVILLDDALARQVARGRGLEVWGTVRVLLEAKQQGLVDQIEPLVSELETHDMWLSEDIRLRILKLAGERE
jgi:predicted nucleic acid-binding protein